MTAAHAVAASPDVPLDLNDALEKLAPEVSHTGCLISADTSSWLALDVRFSKATHLPAAVEHSTVA